MKNRHVSSLPANAKSQRAVLPSLLGAVAGESSPFSGVRQDDGAVGAGPCWRCSVSPHPSPGSGAARGVHGAGQGGEGVGRVRVPGCLCAQILARGH